ncbi:Acyl transferase/acyl hydrolase/lysophospholipase superfamily protein [Prunus dulcis]|uniref:Acyl transferase/acyl hydrolase/lysophospholipase superfamily protein n=1 Tax=Prunus dulcis TaxID=3755 RepID=A0A4Y1RS86_PRUDU|nr:Acyl transferase/acyl hydrolase/lysophospholipase superfamily protein [Prunus dulcis]
MRHPNLDALLSDVCIGTSAAPSHLPAHQFTDFTNITGTGIANDEEYDAKEVARWGAFQWLIGPHWSSPVVHMCIKVTGGILDYHTQCVLEDVQSHGHYLRIQDDTLSGRLASVDIATKKNLNDLVKVGEALLKKPVSRLDFDASETEPLPLETNAEALVRMAKILSEERAPRIQEGHHPRRIQEGHHHKNNRLLLSHNPLGRFFNKDLLRTSNHGR